MSTCTNTIILMYALIIHVCTVFDVPISFGRWHSKLKHGFSNQQIMWSTANSESVNQQNRACETV